MDQLDLSLYKIEQSNALVDAAKRGDRIAVKSLLESGSKINALSPQGTAFSVAMKAGHAVISQFLLSAGADWRLGFKPGEASALMIAAQRGNNSLVKSLLVNSAELDYRDARGYSALALAAIEGHLTTVKVLINAGADVDVIAEGRSLLMHLVADNNILLSQQLIAAGADVNFYDAEGDSALRIARRKGYYDIDLMLVQSGAGL